MSPGRDLTCSWSEQHRGIAQEGGLSPISVSRSVSLSGVWLTFLSLSVTLSLVLSFFSLFSLPLPP